MCADRKLARKVPRGTRVFIPAGPRGISAGEVTTKYYNTLIGEDPLSVRIVTDDGNTFDIEPDMEVAIKPD